MEPGHRPRHRRSPSASRPAGSPTACRFEQAVDDAHRAGSRPTPSSTAAGFDDSARARSRGRPGVPPVTPDAFDPAALGAKRPPKQQLQHAAGHRRLALDPARHSSSPARSPPDGRRRDPRPAPRRPGSPTTTSSTGRKLSSAPGRRATTPTRSSSSSAPTRATRCPGPTARTSTAAAPTGRRSTPNRARQMMDTYRQGGAAQGLLADRADRRATRDRQRIDRRGQRRRSTSPPQPWRSQVRVVDTVADLHPGRRATATRSTSTASTTIVRESDGIHLNEAGSALAADIVLGRIDEDFTH